MKQIQYHTTHPHQKTIVRPNDNAAVGNHWRKSVWGNPGAVSPSWALGGQGNPSPKAHMPQTAGRASAGQGQSRHTSLRAAPMIHGKSPCGSLHINFTDFLLFSSLGIIGSYPSDSTSHTQDNMLLQRTWFVKNITTQPWANHWNSPMLNVSN